MPVFIAKSQWSVLVLRQAFECNFFSLSPHKVFSCVQSLRCSTALRIWILRPIVNKYTYLSPMHHVQIGGPNLADDTQVEFWTIVTRAFGVIGWDVQAEALAFGNSVGTWALRCQLSKG